jgi:hypothetical protein
MDKKRSNLIEQSIEKGVLVLIGLACVFVLYKYVLRSPNIIKYDDQNFSAGQLDIYTAEQAEKLKAQLSREPAAKAAYEPWSTRFLAKMNCTMSIDTNIIWPVPSSAEASVARKYRIPVIGEVNSVAVEPMRAAAYVPKVEITKENINSESSYEPNDIDLVTVQASFDIAALADGFQECFAGKDVPEDWRDAVLAHPVFAAVQLQRQRLVGDDVWGEWEEVPRARTDPYRVDFRIMEDASGLPSGGVTVRLLKMSDSKMQIGLLQPEPYQIASADEEWFPPALHKKFLTIQRDKESQERRETIAAERGDERDKSRAERERRAAKSTAKPTMPMGGGGGYPGMEEYHGPPGSVPSSGGVRGAAKGSTAMAERERRASQTQTEQSSKNVKASNESSVYDEMDKISLVKKEKDLSKLRESIYFWAYDDTVEPGKSYRYRIRLGVFNPVAGTGQVQAEDAAYDSKVILWSSFSDVTDEVAIPKRLYFFPVNVQETAKGATSAEVQVCKYALGSWHSAQFVVKRGEVIGKVVKVEPSEQNKDKSKDKDKDKDKGATQPEMIDYGTGAVLVDLVAVNDWSGDKNLQSRHYFDMLYSFDGTNIERVAAKLMSWPNELHAKYSEIKALEKKPKAALRAWGGRGAGGGRRISPGGPAGGAILDEQTMEEMRMRGMIPGQ